jgi:hypothetical protein
LITVKENFRLAVVSVLVGLSMGVLTWGATSSWGIAQLRSALMNDNGMMGSTSHSGSGMISPSMMGGMMQGMSGMHNMMGPMSGMMHSPEHEKMMSEHMAQCQQMMGTMMNMMQQHLQASGEKK